MKKIESVILYWCWDSGLAGPVDVAEAELVIHVKCQTDVISDFMVVELATAGPDIGFVLLVLAIAVGDLLVVLVVAVAVAV